MNWSMNEKDDWFLSKSQKLKIGRMMLFKEKFSYWKKIKQKMKIFSIKIWRKK